MIESLELRGFQSHKKLRIKFDPRVTTIVGDTDTGKSAIFRALGWVIRNRPDGDSFINWDCDAAIATLEVDGQIIVRSRGKGENGYNLNGDEFAAFGKTVPDRVAELLRMSDVNFQAQHDSVFWFSDSAGEVSRQLNHVINLGVIDDVLGFAASRVRKTRATVEVSEERIRAAKKVKEELAYVVPMDEALQKVEELEQRYAATTKERTTLSTVLADLTAHARTAKSARQAASRGQVLMEHASAALKAKDRCSTLQLYVGNAQALRKRAKAVIPDISPLTELRSKYEKTVVSRDRLKESLENLRGLWRERRDTKLAAEQAHKELHEKMEGQCPLCGHATK